MRFGLIGCGGIGKLRAEAISSISDAKIVAACDVVPELAAEISKLYGAENIQDWHSLIENANIDAIIISTPPNLHAEMAITALKAGKHVLCEKPLARTPAECQEMLDAAEQYNKYLATGFNYRFYPSVMKARELLNSGIIGELDHIRSYTGYSAADHSQEWLHDVNIMGGGALRDNGIHLIDLTCYFLGDVAEVKGFASNYVWGFEGCEDNGFALLKNKAGNIATLQASWTEWRGYQLQIDLYGSKGYITLRCFPMMTKVCWKMEGNAKQNNKTFFFPKTFVWEHIHSYRWVVVQSFIHEIRAFAGAISGEKTTIATGWDGFQAVDIAHRASQFLEKEYAENMLVSNQIANHQMEQPRSDSNTQLSVVIVTLGGRDYIPSCLAALKEQIDVPDVEIIIPCDERIYDLDSLRSKYPSVQFVPVPGRKTYAELRAIGFHTAKGAIVALTEDHCMPEPHWCANIIKEHEKPYAAVGGPVDKEGKDTILNWAIYLNDFGRYMSPMKEGNASYLTDCNVSYKRNILYEIPELWRDEFHETTVNWELQNRGYTLHLSPEVKVFQQRSLSYRFAFRERYAFGRLFASTRVAATSAIKRMLYATFSFLLPALFVLRVAKNVLIKKKAIGRFIIAIPSIAFLGIAWAWGEFLGYLTGKYDKEELKKAEPASLIKS